MKKLIKRFKEDLFTQETTYFGKLKNIVFGAVLYVVWAYCVLWIYKIFVPEFNKLDLNIFPILQFGLVSPEYMFVSSCIFAPFIEELVYRLHLSVVRHINIKGIVLYAILLSSAIFGLEHWGRNWTVPIQGIAGLIFCWVYIKNGYSYWSSVLMHFFINFYFFIK